MRPAWPVLCALLSACGPPLRPCTDCPPIEGSYLAHFEPLPDDTCPAASLTPELRLVLAREAAALRGTLGDLRVSGTIYDSWDFGLTATGGRPGAPTYRLRGRYLAGSAGAADTLRGSYLPEGAAQADGGTCSQSASFDASRQ